jgi:two-component system copper resistance phosphate regulon response regulator CusR
MRVLVVDDEPEVADLVARAIREAAWACDVVATGAAALSAVHVYPYDAVVLDLGLPDMDGMEVCRRARKAGAAMPIIMLTARHGLGDRVRGLDVGADDYLPKPFAIEELLARLRALMRRPPSPAEPTLRIADLELDPATRTARRDGHNITLTAREYALLEYLLRNPDRVVNRGQILDHVWDDNFDPIANAVEVLVSRVRRKIASADGPPLIHTLRGMGYILSERAPDGAD